METRPPRSAAGKAGEDRAGRLKAALKANIARRKAQARARGEAGGETGGETAAGRAEDTEDRAAGQGKEG